MSLDTTWLWIAAAAALMSWGVHTFVGAPRIIAPLMASNLPDLPRYVLYFVWHLATIVLLSFPVDYALAALYPQAWPLALSATIVCALIGVMILFVAVTRRRPFRDMPQWTLFLTVAAIGGLAIWL